MRSKATSLVMALAALLVMAGEESRAGAWAQSPPDPLAGSWQLRPDETVDDERNWRRPVRTPGITDGPTRQAGPITTSPLTAGLSSNDGSGTFDNDVRRALRDLLEPAEAYTVAVTTRTVAFTDDLDRTVAFQLTGKGEKVRLGGTEFDVRSTWDGRLLTQQFSSSIFKATQVFMPSADGQRLFQSVKVTEPVMKPPIKDVSRVYGRVKDLGGLFSRNRD